MTKDKRTHYSQWTIDLVKILGNRLATTVDEVYAVPAGFTQIHSNACNARWGIGFVSSHEAHLKGVRATCLPCQEKFEAALAKNVALIHIMPDHHLAFCGQCNCISTLKNAPDEEIEAFFNDGQPETGPRGSITCTACLDSVEYMKRMLKSVSALTPRLTRSLDADM